MIVVQGQDGFLSGLGLVQEFRALDDIVGNVGIGAAFRDVGLEGPGSGHAMRRWY